MRWYFQRTSQSKSGERGREERFSSEYRQKMLGVQEGSSGNSEGFSRSEVCQRWMSG